MSVVNTGSPKMEALKEFHYFPMLPGELQDMIWELYSKSLPSQRHNFHLHCAPDGHETYHYIVFNCKTKFFEAAEFRHEEDELSSVHGALAMPETVFPIAPCPEPGSKKNNSFYLAVDYEHDVFCFFSACCNAPRSYGAAIAKWFGISSQAELEDVEGSLPVNGNENRATQGGTQQRIFSARRLAFHLPAHLAAQGFPVFEEQDLKILARFERLKQIAFVVDNVRYLPASIRARAKSRPKEQHPVVFGAMLTASHFDSAEHAQLLKGQQTNVEVMYVIDLFGHIPGKEIFD
ncbi:hypothetical protein F5X98DRAFT_386009 [Xylaria grammica]|nr:hypothetical protein F5X98DRAFT_386009 [Xylaria grammica]